MNKFSKFFASISAIFSTLLIQANQVFASEADLIVPDFKSNPMSWKLLLIGLAISVLGLILGAKDYFNVKKIKKKDIPDIGYILI